MVTARRILKMMKEGSGGLAGPLMKLPSDQEAPQRSNTGNSRKKEDTSSDSGPCDEGDDKNLRIIKGSRGVEDETLMHDVLVTVQEEQQILNESVTGECAENANVTHHMIPGYSEGTYEPCNMKLCVLDARSYTAALSNGYQGGGYENMEHYPPNSTLQFLGLSNIHVISSSHASLLHAINNNASSPNWFSVLESTGWLGHVADLLRAAGGKDGVVGKLVDEDASVLVGLQVLIEKEWISYGHPFRSRDGLKCNLRNNDNKSHAKSRKSSSRFQKEPPYLTPSPAPVFLLFLTCLHNLLQQFPYSFEYNDFFLLCLARAAGGNSPFGDFLCNSEFEREAVQLRERTKSIWFWVDEHKQCFKNAHYHGVLPYDLIHHNDHSTWNDHSWKKDVLRPDTGARVITLWSEYYFPKDDYSIALLSAPPGTDISIFDSLTHHPYHLDEFPSEYYLVSLFTKRRKRRIAEKVWTVWRSFVLEKKENSSNPSSKKNDGARKSECEDDKWDVLGGSELKENELRVPLSNDESDDKRDRRSQFSLAIPQKIIHEMQLNTSLSSSPSSASPSTYSPFNDYLTTEEDDTDIEEEAKLMLSSELYDGQLLEWVHLSSQDNDDSNTTKILTKLLKEAQMDEHYSYKNIVPQNDPLTELLNGVQLDQVFCQSFCPDTETMTEMLKEAQSDNPYLTRTNDSGKSKVPCSSSPSSTTRNLKNSNSSRVSTENNCNNLISEKKFLNLNKFSSSEFSKPLIFNYADNNSSSSDLSSEFVFV
ncbi:13784_t:CDS:2 [Acaulospora colombiana]|uniref:13784_t:CDS:1 n=1 Tax=Acaulospora colombiana TaxID=27376 RepID=A0ACA9KWZ1_9GLOM|nr:13784_t:CDS:2 [Acaulospora colombiana]